MIALALFFINLIVGAGVLAAIDSDGRLLKWYRECPLPGVGHFLVLTLWPVVVFAYYYIGRKARQPAPACAPHPSDEERN